MKHFSLKQKIRLLSTAFLLTGFLTCVQTVSAMSTNSMDDSKLLKSTVASITESCVIGNRFQNSSDDMGPSGQSVYLVKKTVSNGYEYYVFMVYEFKTPGNVQYMTMYSRKLGTVGCPQ